MKDRAEKTLMRETLESIRDHFVADEQRIVLFTTFNFVSGFFEANVLPLLAGESAEELKNSPQVRYGLNDELKKLRCVVVCDQSTEPPAKGNLRYGLMTVGLQKGRFHPKLMLMAGTLKATGNRGLWLAVGSGNLSLSGWGINREVIGATPVAAQHAGELLPLLHWLLAKADDQLRGLDVKEEGGSREILRELTAWLKDHDRLQPMQPGAPTLHIALPMHHQPRALADVLLGERSWQRATVVSPYWGQVDALVRTLGVQHCRFVPSLAAGRYRFPLASLGTQRDWQRSFASFGDDRYTHAKLLLLEDGENRAILCAGSANFTSAALGWPAPGQFANVEAVLRYELAAIPASWRALPALDESVLAEKDDGEEEEQAPPLPPFEVSLFYDWQRKAFGGRLTVTQGAGLAGLVLHVAGMDVPLPCSGKPLDLSRSFKCRQPVRSFSVSWDGVNGERATFHGLVIQVNALDDQLLYQPRPRLDDVLEFLRGLNPALTEDELRKRSARGGGNGGGDGDEDEREPIFDYFGLFQGTWKLREYYRSASPAKLRSIAFDGASRHSVTTLYRAIVLQPDQTNEERIARYIQLSEVRELLDWLHTQGIEPGEDSVVGDIEHEIDHLTKALGSLLRMSPSFKGMFGDVPAPGQVEAFLGWFKEEMKDRGAVHGG